MLPIIFVSILVGISMLLVGKKARSFVEGAEVGNEILMKMVTIVMSVAPYTVFVLIARVASELGIDLLASFSCIVTKSEGKLDQRVFDDPDAGVFANSDDLHIDHEVETEMVAAVSARAAPALRLSLHTRCTRFIQTA